MGPSDEAASRHTQYVVFNKAMQQEAEAKFRHTFARCNTWDSLARAYVKRHIWGGKDFCVQDDCGKLLDDIDHRRAWRVVQKFCESDDSQITQRHLEMAGEEPELLDLAKQMYAEAEDLSCDRMVPDHAVVFKMCQLHMASTRQLAGTSQPFSQPAAKLYMIDEAQDMNRCQAAVACLQAEASLVIMVGDSGQSIYKFRGACTALQDLRSKAECSLTLPGSWRFGEEIAKVANEIQALHCDDNLDDFEAIGCRGLAPNGRVNVLTDAFPVCSPSGSYTVICRTNADALKLAIQLQLKECQRHIRLHGEPLLEFLELVLQLSEVFENPGWTLEYGSSVLTYQEAQEEASKLRTSKLDFTLSAALRVVESMARSREDIDMLERFHRQSKQESLIHQGQEVTTFSLVHQAKGLEWDSVVVACGTTVAWDKEFGTWQLSHDVINCLYVAVTRARRELWLPAEVREILRRRLGFLQAIHPRVREMQQKGCHKLCRVVPQSEVERVKKEGIPADDDGFCCMSGTILNQLVRTEEAHYVVEIDLDILNYPLPQHPEMNLQTFEVRIQGDVPPKFVRRTYPLNPNGEWPTRHGSMSPEQWNTSFGSNRNDRAARIFEGHKAAQRDARGPAWEMERQNGIFLVPSQSQAGKKYEVDLQQKTCSCPDWQKWQRDCKHLIAVKAFEIFENSFGRAG